jgi:GxxExxY protein
MSLGYGLLEHPYSNALAIAGSKFGREITQELPIKVYFEGSVIGEYHADMLVNNAVIVELKARKVLALEREAQLLIYFKPTPYEVGLLLNFGPRPQYKRMVYENSRKRNLSWIK